MKKIKSSSSRRTLAPILPREHTWQVVLGSIVVGLVYVLYHGYSIGLEPGPSGRQPSTWNWMISRWKTGALSYGSAYTILRYAVPIISGSILWLCRHRISRTVARPNGLGLVVVVLALLANWVGVKTEHPRLSLLSLVVLLWGIPFYVYGWKLARIIWFPTVFLAFCIPLNFLDAPMFKVRILATKLCASILNGVGVECVPRATSLFLQERADLIVSMQPATTALGNFILFMTGMAIFAYFARLKIIHKFILFFGVLPAYALAASLTLLLQTLLRLSIFDGAIQEAWWLSPVTLSAASALSWTWYRLLRGDFRGFHLRITDDTDDPP